MAKLTAEELVEHLALVPHPEGGWFRETYRADEEVPASALPKRFSGDRSFCTSIYFLLKKGEYSAFHRIKADELWHFHAGTRLTIHIISPEGEYAALHVGADPMAGTSFQATVPAGSWFGAEITGDGEYALVGCTVAPGFDFADFEMGQRESLLMQYPFHAEIIRRLTHGG